MQISTTLPFVDSFKSLITDAPSARKIKVKQLKLEIQHWINQLNSLPPKERKYTICRVVTWLMEDTSLTLNKMKLALSLIERITLSRRVSSLNKMGFYSRVIPPNKNHIVELEGLKTYISSHYPEEMVFYIRWSKELDKEKLLPALNEKKRIWIILRHGRNHHKTLLMVEKNTENKCLARVWDSLGIIDKNTSNADLTHLTTNALSQFDLKEADSTQTFGERRVMDSTNCGSCVLHDFETALMLLKQSQPLFRQENGETIPHPAFMPISQCTNEVDALYQ